MDRVRPTVIVLGAALSVAAAVVVASSAAGWDPFVAVGLAIVAGAAVVGWLPIDAGGGGYDAGRGSDPHDEQGCECCRPPARAAARAGSGARSRGHARELG